MKLSFVPTRYDVLGIILSVAVLVGGGFLIARIFPSNPPGPTKSEQTADSLKATKPAEQALIDSSNAHIAARAAPSAKAEADAKASKASAERNRRLADSLAVVAATAVDSATAWHNAYDKRNDEAIDLRKTVASDVVTIFNLKADTTDLRFQLKTVNTRLKTTEDVNDGLRKDLEQARKCKILGLVNCPSRIQAVVMAVAADELVRFVQSKRP